MPSFVCWRVGRPFDNRNAEAYSDCGGAFVAQAACDPNKAINRTLWNCACMTRPQRIDGVLIWSAMVNDSFRTVPRRAHIETGRRDVPAAAARSPLPVPTYEILVGAPRESQPQARGYRPLDLRRFVILQLKGRCLETSRSRSSGILFVIWLFLLMKRRPPSPLAPTGRVLPAHA